MGDSGKEFSDLQAKFKKAEEDKKKLKEQMLEKDTSYEQRMKLVNQEKKSMNAEILDLKSHVEKLQKDLKLQAKGSTDYEKLKEQLRLDLHHVKTAKDELEKKLLQLEKEKSEALQQVKTIEVERDLNMIAFEKLMQEFKELKESE